MPPGVVPTQAIYAGDDWSRPFTFTQNGVAVDLVTDGWSTWAAQWRRAAGSAASITITVDDSNASGGVLTLSLTGAQTEQMGGNGVWDLQGVQSGKTETVLMGVTTWTQDVTR